MRWNSFMERNIIEDHEILYRVVRNSYPDAFINNQPTAALFMDPNGASVERDGERAEKDIIRKCKQRFGKYGDYKTAVKITAGECIGAGTYPNPIHNNSNIYHAEIHDSDSVVEICLLKAIRLAKLCREVSQYD